MIIRSKNRETFTVISNRVINDAEISDKALGTLVRLLSKPDNWNLNINHMVRTGKQGRTAVRSSIAELEAAGYIHREVVRGNAGRISGTEYHVYEDAGAGGPSATSGATSTTMRGPGPEPPTGPGCPIHDETAAGDVNQSQETRRQKTSNVINTDIKQTPKGTTTTTPESGPVPVDQEPVIDAPTTPPSSFPAREDINFLVSLVPEQHRKPTVEKLICDALGNHDHRSVEEAVAYATANVKGGWMQYRAYLDKTLQNGWAAGYLETTMENQADTSAVVPPGGFAGGLPAGRFPNGTVTGCKRMDSNYLAAAKFLARRRGKVNNG